MRVGFGYVEIINRVPPKPIAVPGHHDEIDKKTGFCYYLSQRRWTENPNSIGFSTEFRLFGPDRFGSLFRRFISEVSKPASAHNLLLTTTCIRTRLTQRGQATSACNIIDGFSAPTNQSDFGARPRFVSRGWELYPCHAKYRTTMLITAPS